MKSEPNVYSIADLRRDGRTYWDGVRNYQARNFMRDEMQVGDEIFFFTTVIRSQWVFMVWQKWSGRRTQTTRLLIHLTNTSIQKVTPPIRLG